MILVDHAALGRLDRWSALRAWILFRWGQRSMLLAALAFGCVAASAHPSEPPSPAAPAAIEAAPVPSAAAVAKHAPDAAKQSSSPNALDANASADPDLEWPKRTPISSEAAAHYLSDAWFAVYHTPIDLETLAVLWAHWALETGRGERMTGYNFAGIKGRAERGGSHLLWTREKNDSTSEWVQRTFRAYDNPEAGARDYLRLLKRKYPRAIRAARRGSPIDFVSALNEGGYFTDEPEAYLRAISSLTREFLQDPSTAGSFADRVPDPSSRI